MSANHPIAMLPSEGSQELSWLSVPHPTPFVCELRVSADQLGRVIEHVSNIEYVRWLDRAAELHADSLGYTREHLLSQGIMWFVARHEIDYLAETWLNDRLLIATWVRDIHKVKSWRDYVIARPQDRAIICRASTLWVLMNLDARKPMRISREMSDRFQPLNLSSQPSYPCPSETT